MEIWLVLPWKTVDGLHRTALKGARVRILVIDDEEMIRSLAERILTRAGYEVVTASSGTDGYRLFKENGDEIDLVLLDLTMDGMTGVEVLSYLRELSPDIPCIFSSGQPMAEEDLPPTCRHNTFFLLKPYRANVLVEAVKQFLPIPDEQEKANSP